MVKPKATDFSHHHLTLFHFRQSTSMLRTAPLVRRSLQARSLPLTRRLATAPFAPPPPSPQTPLTPVTTKGLADPEPVLDDRAVPPKVPDLTIPPVVPPPSNSNPAPVTPLADPSQQGLPHLDQTIPRPETTSAGAPPPPTPLSSSASKTPLASQIPTPELPSKSELASKIPSKEELASKLPSKEELASKIPSKEELTSKLPPKPELPSAPKVPSFNAPPPPKGRFRSFLLSSALFLGTTAFFLYAYDSRAGVHR